MSGAGEIWAVVPVKDTAAAKQRLAPALPPHLRQALALAMLEDVLAALAAAPGFSRRLLVTIAPEARRLAAERIGGMLTMPGDIPLVTPDEIGRLIAAHRPAPSFTIAPSHDEKGSNAILLSPADAVPLRFGDDSFFPHLAAAETHGIAPTIVRLPGIALDIDNPADLLHFARLGSRTRAGLWLAEHASAIVS